MKLKDLSKEELLCLIARLEESHLFRVTAKDIARVKYETKMVEYRDLLRQSDGLWEEFKQTHSLGLSKAHARLKAKSERAFDEAQALLWAAVIDASEE